MPVEVTVKQADLANTLAAMREWLDRERCNLSHFRHAGDGDGNVIIKADFSDQACADKFHQHFGGAA